MNTIHQLLFDVWPAAENVQMRPKTIVTVRPLQAEMTNNIGNSKGCTYMRQLRMISNLAVIMQMDHSPTAIRMGKPLLIL